MMLAYVSLFGLLGLAASVAVEIPIHRVESLKSSLVRQGKWLDFKRKEELRRAVRKYSNLDTAPQSVTDYYDASYIANISLGTPPQRFTVLLDTGSAFFWVPDALCGAKPECPNWCNDQDLCDACDERCCHFRDTKMPPVCSSKNKFNLNMSSTYEHKGHNFTVGYLRGYQGIDVLRFESFDGTAVLTIPHTVFGQADHDGYFDKSPFDGVIGLAFQSISVNNAMPPLINAINQSLLDQPLFTVFLRNGGPEWDLNGGAITYGGVEVPKFRILQIDTTNCGEIISYHPLSAATYFQYRASISFNGTTWKNLDVMSSTGEGMIGAPPEAARIIIDTVGADFIPEEDMYVVDCNATFADLVITIGNRSYAISTANMIEPVDGVRCKLAIDFYVNSGFGASWVLGAPFHRAFCHIYDIGQQRIGFAKPKQQILS